MGEKLEGKEKQWKKTHKDKEDSGKKCFDWTKKNGYEKNRLTQLQLEQEAWP